MKNFFKKTRDIDEQYQALLSDIDRTKRELENAYTNFENVVNPDLIDCYIFEVNSVQKRYKFLMDQVKAFIAIPQNPNSNETLS